MANEATAELARQQSRLNKEKLKTDYEQYLEDLSTKYGISFDQLNANLESRGILRSGEAGTARTRLGAAEEAARTTAGTNYQYNLDTEDTNLATKLAGLMTGGTGGGGSGGGGTGGTGGSTTPPPSDTSTPAPSYRSPDDPYFDGMRDRGPRPPVAPVATVEAPQARTGTADSMERNAPALPDLSGVDWAGLGRMIEANKTKRTGTADTMARTASATTRITPPSARNR
jgi:hypothetical protein